MKFEKPAVSVPDQIELLKRRGMIVGDEAQAQHYHGEENKDAEHKL